MSNRLILAMALGGVTGFSTLAEAACEPGSKTVFSCQTAKGKVIQVCDAGKTIDYTFGKPELPPEIVVRAPRGEASTFQWQGIGRYITYSVSIPNGTTVYSAFWSLDKLSENRAIEAGVNVEVNKRLVATVNCLDARSAVQNIEGIHLKPAVD